MATWSKNFLLEFIELFRQEECLWKVKSKDYYNRSKKDASYRTLIGKVREVEPDATRYTVVKKINNLRSAFRKEHKKVLKSQVSDAGAEKMYAPRLWYYNQLLFLCNQEALHSSTSIMQEEEEDSEERGPGEGSDLAVDGEVRSPSCNSLAPSSPSSDVTSNRIATPKTFSRKRKMSPSYAVLSLVNDRLQDLGKEDMFEITGKNVASKLRILTNEQRIIAEKLINEVLYEAQLGTLARNSRLILNEPHGCSSPVVHLRNVTKPMRVGSAQHSYRATQPVDGESAQHLTMYC